MINLYREVYEDPKQRQFPIRSAAEAPWHAPIDPPLPPAFFELTPPHFAASDPHSRPMLEGESGTGIEVSAAKQSRYCDNLHDEKHPGLIFVPVVCLSSHLLTRELRNSQKICEDQLAICHLAFKTPGVIAFFLGRSSDIYPAKSKSKNTFLKSEPPIVLNERVPIGDRTSPQNI